MEAKEIEARIRGELENYGKDAIEYYQKTGLNHPGNLPAYAKRITEISFKAGYKKCEKECEAGMNELAILGQKRYQAGLKAGKEEGKQEGFDKVVEWVEENCIGVNTPTQDPDDYMGIQSMKWQAFLKGEK